MTSLGKLEEIKDLRSVWPHEALDFTPWLAQDDNIAILSDAVGLDITVDETESSVGDFNVDIFASETGTERKMIIENQLEDTDHDHLGKLITYAAGKAANETQQQRYDYWVAFQDYGFKNELFARNFNRRKPSMDHWMNFSIGSSACCIMVSQIQKRNELDVELYISGDKELFHSLLLHKESIEAETGLKFDWRELPERKASRIVIEKKVDFGDKKQWKEQFDWLIEVMVKMKKVFRRYL